MQLDVEIDTELYEKADYVVNKLGFTMEDVIRSFITRVVATKGLPFDLSLTEEEKSDMREYFTEKIVISPNDIAIVTEQISDTWQKIQNKEFTKGCGKPDCDYCNLVKNNKIFVKLHNLSEQEEGNLGIIVLSGYSPTILLDAAPHTQSFGGSSSVSLNTIADAVIKEALNNNYDFRID